MSLARMVQTDHERDLLDRAARWPQHRDLRALSPDALRVLTAGEGIDFATAILFDRVVNSADHGPFLRRLWSLSAGPDGSRSDATVVVVPGALYREYPRSGADGRLFREEAARFGCRTELIPLPGCGPLGQCARIILDWLSGRPAGERIILVSVSKGGADVKTALAQPGSAEAFRNVELWINLCGLLGGSPLVNWMRSSRLRDWFYRAMLWLWGIDYRVICELTHGPAGDLDFELRLPAHLRLINVVGFPLSSHPKNRLGQRCFRRLEPLGPNDGGLLLADACRLPGLLCPVWGADHYLRPAWGDIRELAARLLHYASVPSPLCGRDDAAFAPVAPSQPLSADGERGL